jgi:RND superfamily putative drug exporter
MATLLSRLGRWAFRHRWTTIVIWLGALVGVTILSAAIARPESTSFSIPGTQSQVAMDLLTKKFPQASGASAQVVFRSPAGTTLSTPSVRAGVLASLSAACHGRGDTTGAVPSLSCSAPQVVYTSSPYEGGGISSDGRIGYATVAFTVPANLITERARTSLAASAAPARKAGALVAFGGGIVPQPTEKSSDGIGMLIAYLVLLITFGSLLVAGLPLVTALISVSIALTSINALSGVVPLSATAPILATMIGLAVAIDYALFIVHRYREEIGRGLSAEAAAARATGTAGTAVIFAGMTVIIALVGLSVAGIPFLTIMGLCAAGAVAVAAGIAVTLVPALLGLTQRWIHPPKVRTRRGRGLFRRWVETTTGHPVIVSILGVGLLLLLASPLLGMRLGLPSAGTDPVGSSTRTAYSLMAQGFGPGINGPLLVVVDAPARLNPVAVASSAVKDLAAVPGVASVSPPEQNSDKTVTVVIVTPTSGPSSPATEALVAEIRQRAAAVAAPYGAHVYVTGPTAVNIDVSAKLGAALPLYLFVVVGLAALILAIVFRSLLVPLKAVLGFLLSIGATLGIVVWIFQQGHLSRLVVLPATSPVVSFLPILLVGILFGLAMDYEMFLVSRMRESHARGLDPKQSIVEGFLESGPVVTAAGIIMLSVFASFVISKTLVTKEIGFALAAGVLIDAFVIRMTLVPAAMALLGRSAWWFPTWLDRILPHADLEGSGLEEPPQLAESNQRS